LATMSGGLMGIEQRASRDRSFLRVTLFTEPPVGERR
jgi:hypothetical protein